MSIVAVIGDAAVPYSFPDMAGDIKQLLGAVCFDRILGAWRRSFRAHIQKAAVAAGLSEKMRPRYFMYKGKRIINEKPGHIIEYLPDIRYT